MGNLFTNGKNEYYWRLMSYLQDENVYVSDRRVVPYTPALLQDYVDFFPQLYTAFPVTTLSLFINNKLIGYGTLNDPSGLFYLKVSVPKGAFTLQVKNALGDVLRTEFYNAKNYAMFMEVAAQSYADRRVQIEQLYKDLSYDTLRSERVYPVVGAFFGFLPPPGWTNQQYRDAVLGDGADCPGFVSSFFQGGSRLGFIDTIKSITCDTVTLGAVQNGDRWVVFDDANAPSPTDTLSADAWFVSDADDIPAPNHRVLVMSDDYIASAVAVTISGATRVVVDERVFKSTNSYLESPVAEAYVLAGKTFTFAVGEAALPTSMATKYTTTFGALTTTAAQAAADILAQNPALTSAVYATSGRLRLGVAPVDGVVQSITAVSGSALGDLGFYQGQFIDVGSDTLANPYSSTTVSIVYGAFTFIEGVNFAVDQASGAILWNPSSLAEPNIPPAGAVMQASYSYVMRREIETMAEKAKDPSLTVEYIYA